VHKPEKGVPSKPILLYIIKYGCHTDNNKLVSK